MYLPLKRPTKTSITPLYKTCLAALIAASLTACGGGSSGSDDAVANLPEQPETPDAPDTPDTPDTPTLGGENDGNVSFIGTVGFNDDDAFGSFISLATPIPVPTLMEATDFFQDMDACEVSTIDPSTFDPDDTDPDVTDTDDLESIQVSAGEVLTVISPAGTFAELVRFQSDDEIDYELADGAPLPGPVPTGTVVNIPGDVFPAFTGVAIPAAANLANLSPSSLPISVSDEFTWTPTSGTIPTFVFLVISGNFSLANNSITNVTCTLIDDGSFTLPADIQAELLGLDFDAIGVAAGRSGLNIVTQGNAAVVTFATSANVVFSIDDL